MNQLTGKYSNFLVHNKDNPKSSEKLRNDIKSTGIKIKLQL